MEAGNFFTNLWRHGSLSALVILSLASCAAPAPRSSPTSSNDTGAFRSTVAPAAPAATSAPADTTPTRAATAPAMAPAQARAPTQPTAPAPVVSSEVPQSPSVAGALQSTTEKAVQAQTPPALNPTRSDIPPAAAPTQPQPTATISASRATTPTIGVERRLIELEWPQTIKIGDSGSVRLSLQPSVDGYIAVAETENGKLLTKTVNVPRPPGYDIRASARLEGVTFDIQPTDEREFDLPEGQPMEWRWTISPRGTGLHQLSLNVHMQQVARTTGVAPRDYLLYSRGLDVQVTSVLGMNAVQSGLLGGTGLLAGALISVLGLVLHRKHNLSSSKTTRLSTSPTPLPATESVHPNMNLQLEIHPGIQLPAGDATLIRALFRRYQRVVIEREFRSGYSGARTYLVLPLRADGRADAYTIAKIGATLAIEHEFNNYQQFVKDSLPPITARIQESPVTIAAESGCSVLRYTFIGQPGHSPTSLRQALIQNPDPLLLDQLFDNFGPNWWLQRKPYTFRAAVEYDRTQPPHWVLAPVDAAQTALARTISLETLRQNPESALSIGDIIRLPAFPRVEARNSGPGWSLEDEPIFGQVTLRLRWMGTSFAPGMVGCVIANRDMLLRDLVTGLQLFGLPPVLPKLATMLQATVIGMQSTIHGDLNVENILVGPGRFVWLIDFARTREGHAVFDFAHLEAEIIAHVIAPNMPPSEFIALIQSPEASTSCFGPLLSAIHKMASRCLFNPTQSREYDLALALTCLGAIKHANLGNQSRQLLYLAAASVARNL